MPAKAILAPYLSFCERGLIVAPATAVGGIRQAVRKALDGIARRFVPGTGHTNPLPLFLVPEGEGEKQGKMLDRVEDLRGC